MDILYVIVALDRNVSVLVKNQQIKIAVKIVLIVFSVKFHLLAQMHLRVIILGIVQVHVSINLFARVIPRRKAI